jgi:predicted RNase H-like HicB family nuclease
MYLQGPIDLVAYVRKASMKRRYAVVYEKAPNNYSACVPDLPGCIATCETREEAEQSIKEAISFHLEGQRGFG